MLILDKKVLVKLSPQKATQMVAVNAAFCIFIFVVIPLVAGKGMSLDLKGIGYPGIFLYIALLGGAYFFYSILIMLFAIFIGNRAGIYIKGNRLLYLNDFTFNVRAGDIGKVDLVDRKLYGNSYESLQITLEDGRVKYIPTRILEGEGREIADRVRAALRF